MQLTRRKLFGSLLAVVAAPFAPKLEAKEEKPEVIIRAGDPGATDLEVYNLDTGAVHNFVLAISLGRWIDVVTYFSGDELKAKNVRWRSDSGRTEVYDYEIPTARIPGNWQVRQKPKKGHQMGKDYFGYKRQPVPSMYQADPAKWVKS